VGLALPALGIDKATDLHIAGTVEVTLTGIFTVIADGSLDLGQVRVADGVDGKPAADAGVVRDVDGAAMALHLHAAASGGPGSFAIDVNLVSLTQGARSWLGVDASGISLSLALDPLSVSVTGGALKLNRASGAGAAKLDWDSFVVDDPSTMGT